MLKKQRVRLRNWQAASTNRKIFSAMVVVMAMTVLVKFAATAKELIVAGSFGTGEMVDAFLIAFLLPMFAINVLAGSFVTAMMPTYIRIRDGVGMTAARQLFSSVMLLAVLFLVGTALLLAVLAPVLLPLLGSGFSEQTMELTRSLFYGLLPVLVLTGIGHLYSTVINAGERFALVALAPAITPLCSILALLLLVDKWGIHALVAGTLLGAMVELGVLARVATRRGIPLLPRWGGMTDELRTVMGQYAPMMAGAFLMSSTLLVDQAMAAMLESGSVATLNYANKVVALFLGLGAMALGTAVLPHFSRMIANNEWSELRHSFKTYARLIIIVTLPVTILLLFFSEPIIELLFERGAFTAQDTRQVAQVQTYYLLQLPFYMLGILGVRLISALAKNEILMKIAFVNLIVNIIGNYVLMQCLGVAGIALSTALVYLLSTGMVFYSLLSFKVQNESRKNMGSISKR